MHRALALALFAVIGLPACSSGGGNGGASVGDFCEVVKSFDELQNELGTPDIDPSASPDEQLAAMKDTFETLRDRVEDMRNAAPAEIEDAVDELVDAALAFIDLFLEADSLEDLTTPEAGEKISAASAGHEDAQKELRDYAKKECDIDLDDE